MKPAHQQLEEHFAKHHANPPAPFNPSFDPTARATNAEVSRKLELAEDLLDENWSREERASLRKEMVKLECNSKSVVTE